MARLLERSGGEVGDSPPAVVPLSDAALGSPFLATQPRVLHAVGSVTQAVYAFLAPVLSTLADEGARQIVLLQQDDEHHHLLTRLDPRVELDVVPRGHAPAAMRWWPWLQRLQDLLLRDDVDTVHAHGLIPTMLAERALRRLPYAPRLYSSPHGSRAFGRLDRIGMRGIVFGPLLRKLERRFIVNSDLDARRLSRQIDSDLFPVENPVAPAYFATPGPRSATPLIVGGVYDDAAPSVERFAQIAVLLGNRDRDISFRWLNAVDDAAARHLRAASIEIQVDEDGAERSRAVAAAWLYLVPCAVHGYAQHITEAMACGTPCVALDTPHHRDLIRQGVTGFLFRDEAEMLERIAVLIDEPEIASVISRRAREVALERFAPDQFALRLLDFYRRPE